MTMAITKFNIFNKDDKKFARFSKALSHPARIAILNLLIKKGECICSEVVMDIPLSQSTVSQHLKELKSVGLIKGHIEGPRVCYCIDLEKWKEAKLCIEEFFSQYVVQSDKNC